MGTLILDLYKANFVVNYTDFLRAKMNAIPQE